MEPEKIRKMIRLDSYIQNDKDRDLGVSRYYRSDYIGLHLLKNFVLMTIGYVLAAVLAFGLAGEDLLDTLYASDITYYVLLLLAGYAAVLILYSIITYVICSTRYHRSKKMQAFVDEQLEELEEGEYTMITGRRRRLTR